ncbi:MAG: SCO family protein [Chloroflexi bacterium]|nr:MAG: SCO family protein [Chloroflexota bacterium]
MTLTRRASLMSLFAAPAAGALFAWSTNWPASATNPTPKVPPAGGFGARYFPNVLLRTHEGEEVRFYDDLLQGKSVIINMMYTLCQDGRCGVITSNLVALQRELGDRVGRDIFMYSISLKPLEDTPRMLLEYAARQHVGPGWQFLTGDPADIELLRRRLGFINVNPVKDADINSHTGAVRFGNERLERWCMAPGGTNPRYLATLVESALL